MDEPAPSQRLDKWLWHARVTKTRSLAQKLIASGKIRIDSTKTTSASQKVKFGQVLTITLPREIKILEIIAFAEKRGPYSQACLLYTDLSPPKPDHTDKTKDAELPKGMVASGRPSKHDRKTAIRLKQNTQ